MSANTAAGALSRFLSSAPETSTSGVLMERLANLLHESGAEGLELSQAIERAGLSKADFLTILSPAQANGVLEIFDADGVSKVRLGPIGKSLF